MVAVLLILLFGLLLLFLVEVFFSAAGVSSGVGGMMVGLSTGSSGAGKALAGVCDWDRSQLVILFFSSVCLLLLAVSLFLLLALRHIGETRSKLGVPFPWSLPSTKEGVSLR